MKVLIVGAAGKTGRAVVEQAVQAGHEVTALVHNAVPYDIAGVDVRVGDASEMETTRSAIAGQDAVIDTVGGKTPYRHTTLERSVAAAIVTAMQDHGVRRLLVTSAVGVGDSDANASPLVKLAVATLLRGSTQDKARMEFTVTHSQLDWVITRPAALTDDSALGAVRVLPAGSRERVHSLTRADLAMFLVSQLTSDAHLRKTVTLANR